MTSFIPVNEPRLDGNELEYLTECIRTGWISSEGPFVSKLEELVAEYCGRRFGIAVSNGTAALETAVLALGIGEGDEVLIPSLTIISCAAAVVRAGGIPVVVDSDPVTWNMDVLDIEKKLTSRTRAIMPVHLYGLPVDMSPVMEIAEQHDLLVIEDAAEALGQTYRGRKCGSFGAVSTLSFYPNKHVTTGEGGMLLTNDEEIAERCRSLRNLCFQPHRRFVHEDLGFNFRMSNLQAAVGVAQMERIETTVRRKREIGVLYKELLADLPGVQLPVDELDYAKNIYWVFGLVLNGDTLDAATVTTRLKECGIGTRPFFWPIHEQPVLRRLGLYESERCPVAERLGRRGFYLPSGLTLTNAQIRQVSDTLHEIIP